MLWDDWNADEVLVIIEDEKARLPRWTGVRQYYRELRTQHRKTISKLLADTPWGVGSAPAGFVGQQRGRFQSLLWSALHEGESG